MITNVRIQLPDKDPITLTLDELRQIWTDIDPLFRTQAACTCTTRIPAITFSSGSVVNPA